MKITFICPFFSLSGGLRVVATYARLLQARGHEVTIVSQAPSPPTLRARVKHMLGREHLKTKTMMPLPSHLQDRHVVITPPRPLVAKDVPDADIIIATWWETAEWVAALPPSKGRKFYLLQDYEIFPYLSIERVIATYNLPLKKIAVSNYIRSEIMANHGCDNIDVIYNSVDVTEFSAPQRTKRQIPTIGLLYTATPRKNVHLAIAAFTLAKKRLPDLQVKIFGAEQPQDTLPLPPWVDYYQAPPQEVLPGIYAACDVWLFTSEKEGFGLPILEAMACRTPVLATQAGAAPDLIDGTNGTLLPATAEAFADEIQRFAQMSDAQWQGYSAAALHTATSYTWDDATDRLLDILGSQDREASSFLTPADASS